MLYPHSHRENAELPKGERDLCWEHQSLLHRTLEVLCMWESESSAVPRLSSDHTSALPVKRFQNQIHVWIGFEQDDYVHEEISFSLPLLFYFFWGINGLQCIVIGTCVKFLSFLHCLALVGQKAPSAHPEPFTLVQWTFIILFFLFPNLPWVIFCPLFYFLL